MNKKRFAIIFGILIASAATALIFTTFLKSPDNVFSQLIGGIANIPTNFQTNAQASTEKFCKHSGGETLNKTGSCTDSLGVLDDYCTDNILHKTYCLNDECNLKRYDCEEYCQGICLTIAGRGYCACPG
jgi:hypothetical protein